MFYFVFIRIIRWSTGLFLVLFVSYSMMFYGGGDPIKQMFLDELGNTALYFVSDLSKAVSGEIHYVDCGFNVIGMPQY